MTIPASHCEAILRGMSKRADKNGDWIQVVWQIHPSDVPQALWNADLRSRWQLAFVEIGDDEQPKKSKRKPATTRAEKARRLCGVPEFQEWLRQNETSWAAWPHDETKYASTSAWVKEICGIQSKSQLDIQKPAAAAWDALLESYEQSTGRMAERH